MKNISLIKTCLLSCYDPRIVKYVMKRIAKLGISHVDPILLVNPVLILANPECPEYRELILKTIGVSLKHHGVSIVEMHDHEDCAYRQDRLGRKFTAKNRKEEESIIIALNEAEGIIKTNFSPATYNYTIKKFIVRRNEVGKWEEDEVK